MDYKKFVYVTKHNDDDDLIGLVFLLAINDYELIEVLYDYDINGKYLKKLYSLCDCDYDLLTSSLLLIQERKEITKEIVHNNLDFPSPAPFVMFPYRGESDILQMYTWFNYQYFKDNYNELINGKKR